LHYKSGYYYYINYGSEGILSAIYTALGKLAYHQIIPTDDKSLKQD